MADKVNAKGFTEEEQAELDQAEKEVDAEQEAGGAKEEPEAAEEAPEEPEQEAPAQAADTPAQQQTKTKPPAGFVPQQALHEIRKELQEEREKRARMEGAWSQLQERLKTPAQQQQPGQQPAQVPEFDKDPIGNLQGTIAQLTQHLNQLQTQNQQRSQADQQATQYNQFVNAYRADVTDYTKKQADFGEAYKYLEENVTAEINARYPGVSAQEVQQILTSEEERMVAHAFKTGKRPAEVVYNLAKARGYKVKGAEPQEDKLARLKKGQAASASLSSTKGASSGNGADTMSLEAYAELMASDPEKADELWPKLAKRGLFG